MISNGIRIRLALGPDVTTLGVSTTTGNVLGYSVSELRALGLMALVHPHDHDLRDQLLDPERAPEHDFCSVRFRHRDGRVRCYRVDYEKCMDTATRAVTLDLLLQDAKQLQRTMHDAADMVNFRAMMEITDDYIYFKDRNHVFTGASQTLVAITDPSEHWTDLLGQTDYDVFPEHYADIYYRLEKEVFAGRPVAHEVQETLTKDGIRGWVDNRKYPITDARGEIIGLFGIARDITQQVQAETALRASEQRFHSLYETMSEGVVLHELVRDATGKAVDYRILTANRAFEQLTGIRRDAAIGSLGSELYGTETAPYLAQYAAVVDSGEPIQFDVEFAPLGKTFSISAFSPRPDQFATVFSDITERMRTAAMLRLQGEITAQAAEGVSLVRASDACFIYTNAWFERMLGYGSGELIGKPVITINADGAISPDAMAKTIISALDRKGTWSGELLNRRKDGSTLWTQASISRYEHPIEGTVWITHQSDISERVQLETDLNALNTSLESRIEERTHELVLAKEAAETANVAKTAFLANMSHEIRTPLHAITGMASLIGREPLTPKQTDRLHKLENAARHLLQVINGVLDLSSIVAGKFDLDHKPLHLQELVDDVIAHSADAAADKHLTLCARMEPLPDGLLGDAQRLKQALGNYVSNALKFTRQGSITVNVRLERDYDDAALLRFSVSDTGIGIPADTLDRVFSAFEQVDASPTREFGGTGLGLTITRRLAEQMGGSAGAESELNLGSTFWFTARLSKQAITATIEPEKSITPGTSDFTWQERYSVGVDILDQQHQQLLALCRQAISIDAGSEPDRSSMHRILDQMYHYADQHFRTEEQLLSASAYPDLESHRRQHEAYLNVLSEQAAAAAHTVPDKAMISEFLLQWWLNHILGSDLHYKDHLGTQRTPGV